MNLTKAFGYLISSVAIYLFLSMLVSITPIFLNVLGIGIANETLLTRQHDFYFGAPMRSIIQGDAGCVQADSELGYRQKIGDCNFKNFEFDTVLKFDGRGAVMTKHNELNTKSNIIVVGDSHAMGWGVSYDETFSYILNKDGYQVTNLSMSSYGTEQEILSAISSEKFRAADTIIIQYCNNDIGKNKKNIKEYSEEEFRYYGEITKSEFTLKDKLHNAAKFYIKDFDMKNFILLPLRIIGSTFSSSQKPSLDSTEHKYFLKNILSKYEVLKTKNIIVFYSNDHGKTFDNWNESLEKINFVDLNLQRSHYNMVDDHLNKNGHEYIAKSLKMRLTELK